MGKLGDVIAHENDVRSINRDVTPDAAHCDAHECALECRRVVDPVAHHAHALARALRLIDIRELVLRQAGGAIGGDSELGGHMRCRRPLISR